MGSKLMVAYYANETSSNSRSRRNGGTAHGDEFTTSNDGATYPTNCKPASRIKSVNGGTRQRLIRMALSRVRKSESLKLTAWSTTKTETHSMKI